MSEGCQEVHNMLKSSQFDSEKLERMSLEKTINMNKSYIDMCKESIREIEKNCNPKDRLEAGVAIDAIINYMNLSLIGWKSWCNLKGMNIISNEEFKEILPKLSKLAISWIKIDKKITITKTKDLENELKDLEKNDSKKSNNIIV